MSKVDEIYNIIKQRIIHGEYPPDLRISEMALSNEFNCSRTPIRQIFQKLENELFVKIVPKSGTYISSYSKKDVVDFIQVRSYIEALAFNICIHSPKNIEDLVVELHEIYDEMHLALIKLTEEGMKRFINLHYSFHEKIVLFTENQLLIKFFRELDLVNRSTFIKNMTISDIIRTEKEHMKIINYLKTRDTEGESFMIRHLQNKLKGI